jgi:hypothetical protein
LQPDTIIPNLYNPQSLNRFSYVTNRPVNFHDPTGHRLDDGCSTTGCNLPEFQKTLDAQKVVKLEKQPNRRKCWAGDEKRCSGFDKALLALDNLDLGDGTIQIGLGGNIFAGIGVRADIGIAIDFKGNIALVGTAGGGGYAAAGGGIGPYLTTTNAPTVHYLQGPNVQIGGQIGEVGSVGAEVILFRGPDRERYSGLSISGAARLQGPWPGEFYGTATGSGILGMINIPDLIVAPFRP